jgi:hypothetical protein
MACEGTDVFSEVFSVLGGEIMTKGITEVCGSTNSHSE